MLATATVAAQVYKGVDKDGQVQYSDAPPPAGRRRPRPRRSSPVRRWHRPPAHRHLLQDRAKDYDKRRTDVADSEEGGKQHENDEIAEENCKSARAGLRDLESGTIDSTDQRKRARSTSGPKKSVSRTDQVAPRRRIM
ncbi:MAG: DUF4124 domain-containing protein [Betaproteobacteria bacterium]|nr:DUF4124 domain-containing protein [Betaproteobacteria bacterium]